MGANEIRAGRAAVEISGKDKLSGSLTRISARFKGWAESIKATGSKLATSKLGLGSILAEAFTTTGIAGAVKAYGSAGSTLLTLSKKTGVTVEQLSKLKYAAAATGGEFEDVEVGLRGMDKFMGKVAKGGEEAADTLRRLGLNAGILKSLSPDQLFDTLAKAVGRVSDPTQRAALAMQVFGKGGANLLPVINNLASLQKEAEELGVVMSTEAAEKAHGMEKALTRLGIGAKGIFSAIGSIFVEDVTRLAERILRVIITVRDWIRENKALVGTVLRTAAAVAAVGSAVVATGLLFGVAASAFGGLASAAAFVGAGLGVVTTVAGAILSPIGLVIGAVVGLAGYFSYASGAAGAAFEMIRSALGPLAEDVKSAFEAIRNAMAAGDLGAAAKVLWALIRVEWLAGTQWISAKWQAFTDFFVDTWRAAVYGTASILTSAWSGLQAIWDNLTTGVLAGWEMVANGIEASWEFVIQSLRKGLSVVIFAIETIEDTFRNVINAVADIWDAMIVGIKKGIDSIGAALGFGSSADTIDFNADRRKKDRHKDDKGDRRTELADRNAKIDAETEAQGADRRGRHGAAIANLATGSANSQTELQQQNAAAQKNLADAAAAEKQARDAGRDAANQGDRDAADKALKEAQDAFAAAKDLAMALTPIEGGKVDDGDEEDPEKKNKELEAQGKSSGTFSASAAVRMGGGDDYAQRTMVATEGTYQEMKQRRKQGQGGGEPVYR